MPPVSESKVMKWLSTMKHEEKWKKGKDTCEDVFQNLPQRDRQTLQRIQNYFPNIIMVLREWGEHIVSQYNLRDSEDLVQLMSDAHKALRKYKGYVKNFVVVLKMYEEDIERVIRASTRYVQCLVNALPDNAKRVILETMKVFQTVMEIIALEPQIVDESVNVLRKVYVNYKGIKIKSKKKTNVRLSQHNKPKKRQN